MAHAEVGSGEEYSDELDFEIPSKRRKLTMKYNRFAEDNPTIPEDEGVLILIIYFMLNL